MELNLKKESDEVVFSQESITRLDRQDLEWLKSVAQENGRKRVRLCAYPNIDDPLHEMFIVHTKNTYIRPHKHLNKSESLHVIQGMVDLVTFDETGNIDGVTKLGEFSSGRSFFHRIAEPRYHTLVISSETVVFHEVTSGPLNRIDTVRAPWAPLEQDTAAASQYLGDLINGIDQYNSTNEELPKEPHDQQNPNGRSLA